MDQEFLVQRDDGAYLADDFESWVLHGEQAHRFPRGAALNQCLEIWKARKARAVEAGSQPRQPPNMCRKCKQVIPPRLSFCVKHNNALSDEHRRALLTPAQDAAQREQRVSVALAYLYRQERAQSPAGPTTEAVEAELRKHASVPPRAR